MNKIININLAQRIIPMNESAYNALNDYLDILKQYFSKEEGGDEILQDMEDRIGELLQEKIKKGLVYITDTDVDEIKVIMGSPEQIVDEAGGESERNQEKEDPAGPHQSGHATDNITSGKRLFRSSSESVIGGVCGGLGAYFNIDPAIVRVLFAIITLFWGSGVIIYCLLWILLPQQATPTLNLKRRWYRNEDHKIIGGVCGGIGAYLNIDPIWPRLVFLLPVLLGTGIGFFANDFFSFSIGGFPAMVLLYLILWASLPKANTLAEKLEMKGKKVDVKNISEAMKQPQAVNKANNNGCLSVFIWLLKALLICIGVFVLIILASIAIGLLGALLGLGISSAFILPFSGLILGSGIAKSVLIVALLLIILIPLYLLIHILVRLISGHKKTMPRWWATTLVILFIAGVFGLFAVAGTVFMDFKTKYSATEDLPLQPFPNDTLVLSKLTERPANTTTRNFWDDELKGAVRVTFEKSADSSFHLQLTKNARGQNKAQAMANVQKIQFLFQQDQNRLRLPEELDLSRALPFRDQHVVLTISVPAGHWIYVQDADDDWWGPHYSYHVHRNSIRYEDNDDDHELDEGCYYQMDDAGQLTNAGKAPGRKDNDTYYY
ncbi:MAG TPA: PspC domain-containing protein [Edaphocola sp.]|nr:PspC domain-containing protein [Edaphocola sp.]